MSIDQAVASIQGLSVDTLLDPTIIDDKVNVRLNELSDFVEQLKDRASYWVGEFQQESAGASVALTDNNGNLLAYGPALDDRGFAYSMISALLHSLPTLGKRILAEGIPNGLGFVLYKLDPVYKRHSIEDNAVALNDENYSRLMTGFTDENIAAGTFELNVGVELAAPIPNIHSYYDSDFNSATHLKKGKAGWGNFLVSENVVVGSYAADDPSEILTPYDITYRALSETIRGVNKEIIFSKFGSEKEEQNLASEIAGKIIDEGEFQLIPEALTRSEIVVPQYNIFQAPSGPRIRVINYGIDSSGPHVTQLGQGYSLGISMLPIIATPLRFKPGR